MEPAEIKDIIIDEPAKEQLRAISNWTKPIGIAFLIIAAINLYNSLSFIFNFDETIDKMLESDSMTPEMNLVLSKVSVSDVIIFTVISTTIQFLHGYFILKVGIYTSPKKLHMLPRAFTNLSSFFIFFISLMILFLTLCMMAIVFLVWLKATT